MGKAALKREKAKAQREEYEHRRGGEAQQPRADVAAAQGGQRPQPRAHGAGGARAGDAPGALPGERGAGGLGQLRPGRRGVGVRDARRVPLLRDRGPLPPEARRPHRRRRIVERQAGCCGGGYGAPRCRPVVSLVVMIRTLGSAHRPFSTSVLHFCCCV
ncbi:hypothetical protein PVAP13_5KG345700 [Panicum virgatum]|uniref:Uncharacterized protein n=1 Tax=Panicum virgatum TaxID=38727 RepID=A0A8T0SGI7_PANVG|nr:hypothetical protein PVAP13_5KG345700 [Panicum virgatum]